MIHAYDENMRFKAQRTLGQALEFASYEIGYPPQDFLSLFIESGLATRFGKGEPAIVMGKSGAELAMLVIEETVGLQRPVAARFFQDRSKEYWIGWVLARYQWETGLSFRSILEAVPAETFDSMYAKYHEMDIRHFVERVNELVRASRPQTNLRAMRKRAGLSQDELSEISGVPVRTIQEYEQRRKDINRAQLRTAMALAQALSCTAEALLERVA